MIKPPVKKEPARVRVGRNIKFIRKHKNISQSQLSRLSGIPKSTLNHIESGQSNPSIEAVELLADSLSVSLEELLSQPSVLVEVTKSDKMRPLKTTSNVKIIRIQPDPFLGLDLYYCELNAQSRMQGAIQNQGGMKLIYCLTGSLVLNLEGESYQLDAGDSCFFPGDRKHSLMNPSLHTAKMFKVHSYSR